MNSDRDDRLRSTLHATAGDLDLDLASADEIAGRGRSRRRNKWIASCSAAVVVVALGTVALTSRNDNGSVQTSDDVTTTPTTTLETPITAPPTLPPETVPSATLPPGTASSAGEVPSTQAAESGGDGRPVVAVDPTQYGQLVPWRDGFVSISTVYPSQPLPDQLPDELRELFPPEVLDLFPDGLPPTLEDAVEILQDADLLDQVTDILTEHPEVNDAIYGLPSALPTTYAWFTTDGVDWEQYELPIALSYPEVTTVGDDIVAWSALEDPSDTVSSGGPTGAAIVVSNDLSTWRSARIDLDVERDVPDYVVTSPNLTGVTVIADRWYAVVTTGTYFDVESLLPEDLRERLMSASGGWGLSYDDDERVTVDYVDEAGEPVTVELTFEELGLSGDPMVEIDRPLERSIIVGDFEGPDTDAAYESLPTPETLPAPIDHATSSTLTAWGDRIVYVGEGVHTSPNGRDWTTVATLPESIDINVAIPTGGDLLLIASSDEGGTVAYRLSPAGGLEEVTMPTLVDGYGLWGNRASPAWIVQLDPDAGTREPIIVSFEHEGLQFDFADGADGGGAIDVRVVDVDSGEVLVDHRIAQSERSDLFVEDPETGAPVVSVVDPTTGVEIARIPESVYYDAQSRGFEVTSSMDDVWEPDLWLIAGTDGTEWLVKDLAESDDDAANWPTLAAVNGDRVLYGTIDGWVLEQL